MRVPGDDVVPSGTARRVPEDLAERSDANPEDARFEPADRSRLSLAACAFCVAPVLLLLLGFVGSAFDPSTRAVARLAAAALVVGAVASRRRWAPAVAAGAVLVFVLASIWVLALPDGRHPVVMAYVLVVAVLVVAPPVLDLFRARRPPRWVVAAAIGGAVVVAYVLALSPLPLRAKVATYEASMDAQARADLAAADEPADAAGPPTFGCFGGRLPDVAIGPFPVCHRRRDATAPQVAYDLGRPVLGVGDRTTYGLVYAPTGPPKLADACTAPVTGAWYEYTRPDRGDCPPGHVRAP